MKASSERGDAANVAVSDGRHRHHEKVDAVPVAQLLPVDEIGRIAAVLQLTCKVQGLVGTH